jgi:SEFIR domain
MAEQDKRTKSVTATCRVFISYSHDSPEHGRRVRALADQLRPDGIESWIDQYVQNPDVGRPKWMRSQVKEASKVLLVFTETYQRRFEGDEEQGKGLGATFEGAIVTQSLYESGGRNTKFRPVVLREEDAQFIPVELRRFNRYSVDTPEHYQNLLRWLHGAPRIIAPTVGRMPDFPAEPASELFLRRERGEERVRLEPNIPPPPLCFGRESEIQDLVSILLATAPPPVLLLGSPGIGKSTVMLAVLHHPRVKDVYGVTPPFVKNCTVRREIMRGMGLISGSTGLTSDNPRSDQGCPRSRATEAQALCYFRLAA